MHKIADNMKKCKSNGKYVARSTVIPVPQHELDSNEMKKQTHEFMNKLEAAIGDHKKSYYQV